MTLGELDAYASILASLVAAVSLLETAESKKCMPSKAVASDKMFRQMIRDYKKAVKLGRDNYNEYG